MGACLSHPETSEPPAAVLAQGLGQGQPLYQKGNLHHETDVQKTDGSAALTSARHTVERDPLCAGNEEAQLRLQIADGLRSLRARLIAAQGPPLQRISQGAAFLRDFTGAEFVSVLGTACTEMSSTDGPRWTVLHSCGAAAAATPLGLQVPCCGGTNAQSHWHSSCPLELRLAAGGFGMTQLSPPAQPAGKEASPEAMSRSTLSAVQASMQLPSEWAQTLQGIHMVCPPNLYMVLLLPLALDGRPLGALLLAVPRQGPFGQIATPASSGGSGQPKYSAQGLLKGSQSFKGMAGAGVGGAAGASGAGEGEAEAVPLVSSGALQDLADCVAEGCLGPVVETVEKLCLAADTIASATSLQELTSFLTATITTALAVELHVELAIQLALLPYKDAPAGVLLYSAERTDGTLSRNGTQLPPQPQRQPSPMGSASRRTTLGGRTGLAQGSTGGNAAVDSFGGLSSEQQPYLLGSTGCSSVPAPPAPSQGQSMHRLGGAAGAFGGDRSVGSTVGNGAVSRKGLTAQSNKSPLRLQMALAAGSRGDAGQLSNSPYQTLDNEAGAFVPASADRSLLAAFPSESALDALTASLSEGPAAGGGGGTRTGSGMNGHASGANALVRAVVGGTASGMKHQPSGSILLNRSITLGPAANVLGEATMRMMWKASPFNTTATVLSSLIATTTPPAAGSQSAGRALHSGSIKGTVITSPIATAAASGKPTGAPIDVFSPAEAVLVRASIVPDVPACLQETNQPNGDLFTVVRRAGVAGGLASLIALVALQNPMSGRAALSWLATNASLAPATNGNKGLGSLDTGLAAAAAAMANGPTAASTGGAVVGRNSTGLTSPAGAGALSASALLQKRRLLTMASGQTPSILGPGRQAPSVGGGPGEGGAGGPSAVLGMYLYSGLTLPLSFLQVARERASSMLQILGPVALRALCSGPIADEWNYLAGQAMGGKRGGTGAQTGPVHHAAPRRRATNAGLVSSSAGVGSGPGGHALSPKGSTTPRGADTSGSDAFAAASTLPYANAGGGGGGGIDSNVISQTTSELASPRFLRTSGGFNSSPGMLPLASVPVPRAHPHPPPQPPPSPGPPIQVRIITATQTSSATSTAAAAAEAGATDPLAAVLDTANGDYGIRSGSGNTSLLLSPDGSSLPPGSRPRIIIPPFGSNADDVAASVGVPGAGPMDASTQQTAHDQSLELTGGALVPFDGNGEADGCPYGTGSCCVTMFTNTMSDMGSVARQQNMATLVTAFSATLARARTDTEMMGGANAEDDVRNLRIVRAIGQGGCSVVLLGRLHSMPVAVKVVLPLPEDDEEGAAAAAATADGSMGKQAAHGSPVGAPKAKSLLVQRRVRLQALLRGARELAVLTAISHPNIVQVYSYCTRVAVRDDGPSSGAGGSGRQVQLEVVLEGAPAEGPLCTVLIMEYCDMGSLADAIDTGLFARAARSAAASVAAAAISSSTKGGVANGSIPLLSPPPTGSLYSSAPASTAPLASAAAAVSAGTSPPGTSSMAAAAATPGNTVGTVALYAAYLTLLEVALALRHLHSMNLVHCDVKPANVLLRSSATDPRGFTAKLTDFGFVNLAASGVGANGAGDGTSSLQTPAASRVGEEPVGTVTHMAPELILGLAPEPSADIYSFGILMWEIYTRQAPYPEHADNGFARVPFKVAKEGLRPRFPPDTPLYFRNLAMSCWSADVTRRPTASALVARLQTMLDASCAPPGAAATRAGQQLQQQLHQRP